MTSCAHTGKPAGSLCLLDFEAKMCWVERGKGTGYPFSEMGKLEGVSWFGINELDLVRIYETLNK